MDSESNIGKLLSTHMLRELAGESSYSRGAEYFNEGRVYDVHLENESVLASIKGSRVYRAELWEEEDGELGYSCTCPFYRDTMTFCKHCVATGLAFMSRKNMPEHRSSKQKAESEMSMKDVEAFLMTQDKSSLITLLLHYAKDDEQLRSRLLLEAGGTGKKVHLPTFKRAIDRAVNWGDFVDYQSMYEYSEGISKVIESLRGLMAKNHAADVVDLSEYFLERLEAQMGMVDDSDGYMSGILAEVQELHHDACVKIKPDPKQLAKKLFEWELHSDWEVFFGAVERYAVVLGKEGLKVYEDLAEKEWKKLPSLVPAQSDQRHEERRFRITSIMEHLAYRTGDIEKLVAVKAKDLSLAYSYLEIAELYKQAGKPDKALEWAENGVQAFPKQTDSRLREFLANEYHKRKRHEDAMRLIWAEFADTPGFEKYKLLKIHAEKAGGAKAWKQWREKALQSIRERIEESKRTAKGKKYLWNSYDHSDLVQIFLWEKDVDAAWGEARDGGCQESLWRELAAKREPEHPEDALSVYMSLVEPQVRRMNSDAYRDAAALVKKIGILFKRLGRAEEWNRYLSTIRANHKRKRNFMALLEKLE